jgi:hypothetical protein
MLDLITHSALWDDQVNAGPGRNEVMGILGGMGPLASAEFALHGSWNRTIWRLTYRPPGNASSSKAN